MTENPRVVSGLSIDNLHWAFTSYWMGHWAPLCWISYQADATLFHIDPGVMHLENVALHGISTLLLYALLIIATGQAGRSFLVAAMFAVHPLHVESVAWITERRDMLSAPPLFASLIAYVWYTRANHRRTALGWYLISLFLFVISLLGKATAITLPVLLLLIDLWPLGRVVLAPQSVLVRPALGTRWRGLLVEKLPFLMISAAVSWAAMRAQLDTGAAVTLTAQPLSGRLTNALVCYDLYLWKFFLPKHLVIFYPLVKRSVFDVLIAVAVLLPVTLVVLWWRRTYAVFGWLWFLVALLPVIGFFQSGPQSMADRYMYIPMIGLSVGVVWTFAEFQSGRWAFILSSLVIGLLTIGTIHQVGYWKNTRTLMGHAVEILNDGADLHIQIAKLDLKEGDRAGAEREYLRATLIDPQNVAAVYDLGNLLLNTPSRAIPHYERALQLQPHTAIIENNLAIAWIGAGRADLAFSYFQAAIADDANYAAPHANLGLLMLNRGHPDMAGREFAAAIGIDPANAIAITGIARLNKVEAQRSK